MFFKNIKKQQSTHNFVPSRLISCIFAAILCFRVVWRVDVDVVEPQSFSHVVYIFIVSQKDGENPRGARLKKEKPFFLSLSYSSLVYLKPISLSLFRSPTTGLTMCHRTAISLSHPIAHTQVTEVLFLHLVLNLSSTLSDCFVAIPSRNILLFTAKYIAFCIVARKTHKIIRKKMRTEPFLNIFYFKVSTNMQLSRVSIFPTQA